jgi:hypothetical protein
VRETLTTSVLVQVHVTVLDLQLNGFANTVTEQNEVLHTRLASDFVLIVMQTVIHLDLRVALFVFLPLAKHTYVIQIKVVFAFRTLEMVPGLCLRLAIQQSGG